MLEIATKRRRGRQKEEGEEAERHTFAYYNIYKGKKSISLNGNSTTTTYLKQLLLDIY